MNTFQKSHQEFRTLLYQLDILLQKFEPMEKKITENCTDLEDEMALADEMLGTMREQLDIFESRLENMKTHMV